MCFRRTDDENLTNYTSYFYYYGYNFSTTLLIYSLHVFHKSEHVCVSSTCCLLSVTTTLFQDYCTRKETEGHPSWVQEIEEDQDPLCLERTSDLTSHPHLRRCLLEDWMKHVEVRVHSGDLSLTTFVVSFGRCLLFRTPWSVSPTERSRTRRVGDRYGYRTRRYFNGPYAGRGVCFLPSGPVGPTSFGEKLWVSLSVALNSVWTRCPGRTSSFGDELWDDGT